MRATTIDEVIEGLDETIGWAQARGSRLGYFPALYRKVTLKVRDGIAQGHFGDGARMERLDVLFANRYLEAIAQHRRDETPTRAWRVAIHAAEQWHPVVLQHLLLGMNAHINLDLGIAAAQCSPGDELPALLADFSAINAILASLLADVEGELTQIWPALGLLSRLGAKSHTATINFSMTKARDAAWRVAERLAPLAPAAQAAEIQRLDADVTLLGALVLRPTLRVRTALAAIRLTERGTVREIIEILR